MTQITPMLRQYLGIKEQYPDAILFFRMGDFYEMFFEDAKIASKILGIALTSRGTFDGEKVPMCGVPHHASKSYIARLVAAGKKVAICEQVEDPASSKGIVKREVVRIVTPGSVLDERELDEKDSLYIAALTKLSSQYGLAHVDLSTGEFQVTEVSEWEEIIDELARISPAELLVLERDGLISHEDLREFAVEELDRNSFDPSSAEEVLKEQLDTKSLASYGLEQMTAGIIAAGGVITYLRSTQKCKLVHIKSISPYRPGDFMFLDHATTTNLELFKTIRRQSKEGTLLGVLDKTLTPMGARLLRKWIAYPLVSLDAIKKRLSAVAELKDEPLLREDVRQELDRIYDIERLNGRIALGRATPKDLIALKNSISRLPTLKTRLGGSTSIILSSIGESLDTLGDIYRLLDNSIRDDAPALTKDGWIIKDGYNKELDRLMHLAHGGKQWIADFARQEQERSGIPNLKVGYNKVFGYYIEVSKANLSLVPSHYIRKQTLVGAERYVTQELKEMEEEILEAEEKRISLELELFENIRNQIASQNKRIKHTASLIAQLDVLASLAEVADQYGYARPELDDSRDLEIVEGRHPVIERVMKEEQFVPNDVSLNDKDQQIMIITGPNMAGKSTILRQSALIVLMAQMGSFVPASKARIGLVDRIFSRVGASDDITRGRSTFMVEMNETASILKNATPRSLVILDEIGRGTSTYDGLSIAWAVAEALHDLGGEGVRTLFATHYHELTELVTTKQRVKNFNVAVKKWRDKIIFLRKLVPGATSHSYGIDVARLAGLPKHVIQRAKEILENLEGEEIDEAGRPRLARSARNEPNEIVQLNLFGMQNEHLVKWVKDLDISRMTPLEALVELDKMSRYVEKEGEKLAEK
ncbi:MAG: DNA mismatch repair protein MutS [Deltaproteobacteria bacterium]|nr:DNA mismatch repair protein MutS [Deltaproteobacteria bacterium]MBW2081505.1 DNA mismatch repair protein MutS [Deltaproteobacteria bacterium]HDM10578.1 DNA mismatch repair protein MutS [Desulfobacteraceae bacterium]